MPPQAPSMISALRDRLKVEREKCETCGKREARVFMVVRDGGTAKAHVCLECFEELREVPGGTIEAVSLQDYREAAGSDQ